MGSDCSPSEREFRYRALYDAIHSAEKDIIKAIKNDNIKDKKYCPYGLINKGICKKYPFLLNKTFDSNVTKNKIFNYKDLIKKNEETDFS